MMKLGNKANSRSPQQQQDISNSINNKINLKKEEREFMLSNLSSSMNSGNVNSNVNAALSGTTISSTSPTNPNINVSTHHAAGLFDQQRMSCQIIIWELVVVRY